MKRKALVVFAVVLIIVGTFLLLVNESFQRNKEDKYKEYQNANIEIEKSMPEERLQQVGGMYINGIPHEEINAWRETEEYKELSEDLETAKKEYKTSKVVANISDSLALPCVIIGAALLVVSVCYNKVESN